MTGGRKSIPYSAFKDAIRVYEDIDYPLHYLEGINEYLEIKERSE